MIVRATIFLAHASEDKEHVRRLYAKLVDHGLAPWLDEVDLLPGQNWQVEIPKAIRESGVFIACLSRLSVKKQGYVQREFRLALSTYAEKPSGSIYLIPVKLDDCEVPDLQLPQLGISLRDIQWVDYWKPEGVDRLIAAINKATTNTGLQGSVKTQENPEKQQRLDVEISHRIARLPTLMEEVFTYTQLHTVKGAVNGKAEYHPSVGKLGEFEPLFTEFLERSLFSLIWELQQMLPVQEKELLKPSLASAKDLPFFLDKVVMLAPVGEEDSKWQMDRRYLRKYKDVLRGFEIGRWQFSSRDDETVRKKSKRRKK